MVAPQKVKVSITSLSAAGMVRSDRASWGPGRGRWGHLALPCCGRAPLQRVTVWHREEWEGHARVLWGCGPGELVTGSMWGPPLLTIAPPLCEHPGAIPMGSGGAALEENHCSPVLGFLHQLCLGSLLVWVQAPLLHLASKHSCLAFLCPDCGTGRAET